jgi:hypothetical protein
VASGVRYPRDRSRQGREIVCLHSCRKAPSLAAPIAEMLERAPQGLEATHPITGVIRPQSGRRNNRLVVDPVDWTAKVPFADVDAVVAEDGVGHGDVEIDVLDDQLQ